MAPTYPSKAASWPHYLLLPSWGKGTSSRADIPRDLIKPFDPSGAAPRLAYLNIFALGGIPRARVQKGLVVHIEYTMKAGTSAVNMVNLMRSQTLDNGIVDSGAKIGAIHGREYLHLHNFRPL